MRKAALVVFDDVIAGTVGAASPANDVVVYTDVRFNDILDQFDRISVQGLADQVNAWTAYNVQLEHSNDGRNLIAKATLYTRTGMAANSQYGDSGSDNGTTPSLGLCRLAIHITAPLNTTGSLHLKLIACLRDDS